MVDIQPHRQAHSVPSRGDDSSEPAGLRLLRIDMKGLWVELPREADDLRFTCCDGAELVGGSRDVVFEITLVGRHGEVMQCHECFLLLRERVGFLRTDRY